MRAYELSPEARDDVWGIWRYLALEAGVSVADRVEMGVRDAFEKLAQSPHIGHRRPDLTCRPVLFYRVYSYLIIYRPEVRPLQILGVLHAKRNVARILRQRS